MTQDYPIANFLLKIDFSFINKKNNDFRFQSVEGLSVDYDTEQIKEGGENREPVLSIIPVFQGSSFSKRENSLILNIGLCPKSLKRSENPTNE